MVLTLTQHRGGRGAACAEWRECCHTRCRFEGGDAMSRAGVGLVIDRLLTDENLRIQFAFNPVETVAELSLRGFDLTRDEMDLFCRTDAGLWFLRSALKGAPQQ